MSPFGRDANSAAHSPMRGACLRNGLPPPCPDSASRAAAGVPATWADLKSTVRAAGRFDRAVILRIALARARAERDAFARMGLPQPWPTLFAHEFRLTWQVAKTAMDALVAERIRARLDPAERTARTLELRADLAATAIPPSPSEAAALRARAAQVREIREG